MCKKFRDIVVSSKNTCHSIDSLTKYIVENSEIKKHFQFS